MADRAIRPLVVRGKVVSFDDQSTVLADGAVYVQPNDETHRGCIEAVQPAGEAPPAGFDSAPTLHTDGVIYPGLIDLHNHVAYNVISLWIPRDHPQPYVTRYQWTDNKG